VEISNDIKKLVAQYKKQTLPWIIDLNILIARAAANYILLYNKQHEAKDLTHPSISALYTILEYGGKITQKQLTERLPVSKQAITSALKILEKRGFIKRENHTIDTRVKEIYITDKAIEFIEFSLPLRNYFYTKITEFIDEKKGRQLTKNISTINKFYENEIKKLNQK